MANTPKRDSASNPSWFTPKRLLLMFCIINMLNYVDRGAIASNGVNGSLATCTESGICTSVSGIQFISLGKKDYPAPNLYPKPS